MLAALSNNVGEYLHGSPWLAVLAVFVGGLLTASNPCVLAMIPLMMGFVARISESKSTKLALTVQVMSLRNATDSVPSQLHLPQGPELHVE